MAGCRESPAGGFEVQRIRHQSSLAFPTVRDLPSHATIRFRVACGNPAGATIEIRRGGEDGPLLGTCSVASTGSWTDYATVACVLANRAGTENLTFAFKGGAGELLRLDWFGFSSG